MGSGALTLLDTHTAIWLSEGIDKLGQGARRRADDALAEDLLAISAISFWELAMLRDKGRVDLAQPVGAWREELLQKGLVEIPVSGDIGIEAVQLPDLHGDPADRIIVATARFHRAELVTADQRLLAWPGSLSRHDARR